MEGKIVLVEITKEAKILYHEDRIYGYQPLYILNISDNDYYYIHGIEFDGINIYFYNKYYLPFLKIGSRIPCKIIRTPEYLCNNYNSYLRCSFIAKKDDREKYIKYFNYKAARILLDALCIGLQINTNNPNNPNNFESKKIILPIDLRLLIWSYL